MVYRIGRKLSELRNAYQSKPLLNATGNTLGIYAGLKLAGDAVASATGYPSLDTILDMAAPIGAANYANKRIGPSTSIGSDTLRAGINGVAAADVIRELWQSNVGGLVDKAKDLTYSVYNFSLNAAEIVQADSTYDFMSQHPYVSIAAVGALVTLGARFVKGMRSAPAAAAPGGSGTAP